MRIAMLSLAAGLAVAASAPAQAESTTTRIEPRPFYGATVTIEAGVRVFRPLPKHDRVIINPHNATPVQLNVGDPAYRGNYYGNRR